MGRQLVMVMLALAACRQSPQFKGGKYELMKRSAGHLLVRAEVDGHPLTLIVDTGASITALTPTTAARLGIATTGTTPVNGQIVRTGRVRNLSIASADHADLRIAMVGLKELGWRGGSVHGVLGLDVLARYDLVIDFRSSTLGFHPPHTIAKSSTASQMARVPLERAKHGLVVMRVRLDANETIPAVLDLGSPTSYVNVQAASSTGRSKGVLYRQWLAVGDTELRLPSIVVQDLPVFVRLGISGPAMLLGTDAFAGRTLALAYADDVILVSR